MCRLLKAVLAASAVFLTALFIIPQCILLAFSSVGVPNDPVAVGAMVSFLSTIGLVASTLTFATMMGFFE